jgi:hypothetical protein
VDIELTMANALLLLAVGCYGLCDYGVSPYMAFR